MEKIFIIKQAEIDRVNSVTGSILQTISDGLKGNMTERQALEVIRMNITLLNNEFDAK